MTDSQGSGAASWEERKAAELAAAAAAAPEVDARVVSIYSQVADDFAASGNVLVSYHFPTAESNPSMGGEDRDYIAVYVASAITANGSAATWRPDEVVQK